MQQPKDEQETTAAKSTLRFLEKTVKDVLVNKGRLAEVPYTATLGDTMNALVANKVTALPVDAPPGQWIGAGGSMIMESDKQTGVVRKHYIGMVTMLDILAYIADDDNQMMGGDAGGDDNLEGKMTVPISSIIGRSFEGLSLWTLNPNTSILECMELFNKGIHRALVPMDSQMENIQGVELVESASSYKMLTQMDLLKFLNDHASELGEILSSSIKEIGCLNQSVFAITDRTKVIDAIKCLKTAMLHAVPIVESSNLIKEDDKQLVDGKGRKPIGTFSATDLRGCHASALRTWLPLSALEFTELVSSSPLSGAWERVSAPKEIVSCQPELALSEAIEKIVYNHVHRVWVVDQQGLLEGLVSLTDIVGAVRVSLLSKVDVM
ncbi:SNF1-related protein kinase regulatory subunit gamma-like PV42a [Hibiscus syriacus]|uniref:SNF1-related protein kinase regulatory subunit gamma-like PV42a n=1 Tax=Hibiscus syriacus TaxID=106335 RepID=A0A6A3A895_HIBSY|nr:SNF1-related protein kinase regulatory subunit gamma-like PV42a [Hibiscus syriacus]KAE8700621.1 SNF1-related protein kinase regulatory subunit gamma-like PV42a [Hibiscus syriacus]